jgi:hypothetical protein
LVAKARLPKALRLVPWLVQVRRRPVSEALPVAPSLAKRSVAREPQALQWAAWPVPRVAFRPAINECGLAMNNQSRRAEGRELAIESIGFSRKCSFGFNQCARRLKTTVCP